jgi:hypothetical protein
MQSSGSGTPQATGLPHHTYWQTRSAYLWQQAVLTVSEQGHGSVIGPTHVSHIDISGTSMRPLECLDTVWILLAHEIAPPIFGQ